MKFVLIEVVEREISTPEFFNTFEEAHSKMKECYEEASDRGFGELNDDNAWCENRNHDNCDWKIFPIGE